MSYLIVVKIPGILRLVSPASERTDYVHMTLTLDRRPDLLFQL